jgi:hypothetical protein
VQLKLIDFKTGFSQLPEDMIQRAMSLRRFYNFSKIPVPELKAARF